jgi:branched-chain amino acid transport system substrate-binding protein
LAVTVTVPAAAQLSGKDVKIGIGGPLTTTSAGFGIEMKQAAELAVDERNDAGGAAGAKVIAIAVDDKEDVEIGKAVAKSFCDEPQFWER